MQKQCSRCPDAAFGLGLCLNCLNEENYKASNDLRGKVQLHDWAGEVCNPVDLPKGVPRRLDVNTVLGMLWTNGKKPAQVLLLGQVLPGSYSIGILPEATRYLQFVSQEELMEQELRDTEVFVHRHD